MATLNGAEFRILTIEWATYQNNIVQNIIGSDTVVVQSQGYKTDPIKIRGMVQNKKELDTFQEQFYSGGALTFIKNINSGEQYQVYALGNIRSEDPSNNENDQGIIFNCLIHLKYPYKESTIITTRSKTITTQNQEWSTDNDGNPLKTEGNVDAVPDIQITGVSNPIDDTSNIEYNAPATKPHDLAWDGTNLWSVDQTAANIYKHNMDNVLSVSNTYSAPAGAPSGLTYDGTYLWSTDASNGDIYKHNIDATLSVAATYDKANHPSSIAYDGTYLWISYEALNQIIKHNIDATLSVADTYDSPAGNPNGLTWDGSNLWSSDWVTGNIYKHNMDATLSVAETFDAPATMVSGMTWDGEGIWCSNDTDNKIHRIKNRLVDIPQVYNTIDSTIKCNIANEILSEAIHRINTDGTGTLNYDDDFSTAKFYTDSTISLVSMDWTNDEIDIADDGYIYWKEDTKLPIEGIPTLTSRINITSGIPTIQISIDASTWYDIDTAIVDDAETIYPLDSDGNLSLAGKTLFYWRMDCVKAAAATCSIKNFELDIAIHTIYAKNPEIIKGSSPSTFRIDQDSDSGIGCIIALIYQDRWWI